MAQAATIAADANPPTSCVELRAISQPTCGCWATSPRASGSGTRHPRMPSGTVSRRSRAGSAASRWTSSTRAGAGTRRSPPPISSSRRSKPARRTTSFTPSRTSPRGLIRLARGESGVLTDAERALALARRAKDPQILYLTLAAAAHLHHETGDREAAAGLADRGAHGDQSGEGLGFAVAWMHVLAWTSADTGRGASGCRAVAGRTSAVGPGRIAFADGEPQRAAEICAGAWGRSARSVRAARGGPQARRVRPQRREPGAAPKGPRLLPSVNAQRYIREGEALLAASASL